VVGIEENPQSVEAAGASARASGLGNTRFLAGDLGAVLATVDRVPGEVAVVDPPREGLLPRALELLVARAPKRIVYISCYPQSLVRDLKALAKAGWKATSCTPVDMFPHTSHLETVVTLEKPAR
jgi:tRNA/tmRNA/rRNA uracil-C5-methylase (TrmA/RlmC/RlmD family)